MSVCLRKVKIAPGAVAVQTCTAPAGRSRKCWPRYARRVSRISIVVVPDSAASYAAGQDLAPAALRSAGLPGKLRAACLEVHDDGDLPHQAWRPDRDHPLAQNADQATASLRQLADRLKPLLTRGDFAGGKAEVNKPSRTAAALFLPN